MWTQLNSLYFYHHKASSIFLPPQFDFYLKFELSLKFKQRCLLEKALPTLLTVHQTYQSAATQWYSKFYIIEKFKYNKMYFYSIIRYILHRSPPMEMVTAWKNGGRRKNMTSSPEPDDIWSESFSELEVNLDPPLPPPTPIWRYNDSNGAMRDCRGR